MKEPAAPRWQLVALDGVPATPWRNGGGVTRELLAWPQEGDWRVRISVADVERDGPFSSYSGVERWFAVLEGAGVELTLAGGTQRLARDGEPFQFSGDAAVDCRLVDGATRDLNLMAPPGAGRMQRLHEEHLDVVRAGMLVAVYAPAGGLVTMFEDEDVVVPPRSLAWRLFEHDRPLAFEGALALWMEVRV